MVEIAAFIFLLPFIFLAGVVAISLIIPVGIIYLAIKFWYLTLAAIIVFFIKELASE